MGSNDTIKDRTWIWGHPYNSCKSYYDTKEDMDVTPAEGARYFGAKNVYYVPFGHKMDIIKKSKDLDGIIKTGLSVENWGDLQANKMDETFKLVPLFPNLNRMVFDDFFNAGIVPHIPTAGSESVEDMLRHRERIHAAGLEMWVVLYQMQLDMDIEKYLEIFDGVSFWFWHEPTNEEYDLNIQRFFKKTPNKRRLVGTYLFNFGDVRPATAASVRYQLDHNREFMRRGDIEGFVLHNNNFGNLNVAAYEEAKLWMDEHGDEIV